MIETFPNFSKLTLAQRDDIIAFTARFDPFSDFNFTSLFCWDTDGTTAVSMLNDNLVIRLANYLSNQPTCSILGTNKVDESLEILLQTYGTLELVPEVTIQNIRHPRLFMTNEDRDQHDYVYKLRDLIELPGKSYKVKRNKTNHFMKEYYERLELRKVRFNNTDNSNIIREVTDRWTKERARDKEEVANEHSAINRLLANAQDLNLIGIIAYIDKEPVGFAINEIVDEKFAICHFQKAILSFDHIDAFLSHLVAKELWHFGCKYINWEQDLGDVGLRALKESYNQDRFLKKFTVRLAKQ